MNKTKCKACGCYLGSHNTYQRGYCDGLLVNRFLTPGFIAAMNDIGAYGHDKYGVESFHHRAEIGDHSRGTLERTSSAEIARHSAEHFAMYLRGEVHDHFHTRRHQLAAVAFNAMMEDFFDEGGSNGTT